jgi:hypothetical protein
MANPTTNGMSTKAHAHLTERFPIPNQPVPLMQQQGQNSAALLNQNSWSSMLPQNQNQQFNHFPPSTSWQHSQPMQHHTVPSAPMPQMQPQGYSMPPQFHQTQNTLPFDLTSIVPQQIMQDVLRLSTPVGSSSNDDTILAQALYESKQNGKTYRQALEGLHGVGHTSKPLTYLHHSLTSRSTITPQIFGKITTLTITTVSISWCRV